MIILNIEGRLGNQLFEYAFAHKVSTQFRSMLLIDNARDFYLPKYFRLNKIYNQIEKIPYIRTKYRQKVANLKVKNTLDFTDCTLIPENVIANLQDNAYYKGYFQSMIYFEPINVSKLFQIREEYIGQYSNKYKDEFGQNKTIVVHVRRGDYLTHGVAIGSTQADVSLPKKYYDECFRRISNIETYQIYFIGDDMDYAKEVGKEYNSAKYVHESEIIDFQLLMNADICVISNSTFAWWGAYLNPKENKQVYAPKYFLGFHEKKEFPNGIYIKTGYKEIEW